MATIARVITASTLRTTLHSVLREVNFSNQELIVLVAAKPKVVLADFQAYAELKYQAAQYQKMRRLQPQVVT
ncbi:MAG: hypothetical protein Q7S64_02385 [bacterium]|nr:hypothetical protein [bacterium]